MQSISFSPLLLHINYSFLPKAPAFIMAVGFHRKCARVAGSPRESTAQMNIPGDTPELLSQTL